MDDNESLKYSVEPSDNIGVKGDSVAPSAEIEETTEESTKTHKVTNA